MRRTAALAGILALAAAAGLAPAASAGPGSGDGPRLRCGDRAVQTAPERTVEVSVRCRGLAKRRIRVKKQPRHGLLSRVDQRHDSILYRPKPGFTGADRFVVERRGSRQRRYSTAVTIQVGSDDLAAAAAPQCDRVAVEANYVTPVQVSISCRGEGIEDLELESGPFSGSVADVKVQTSAGQSTLTATYTPGALFVGEDAMIVGANDADGRAFGPLFIDVRPWRMRTIGDSVTAAFGYFGNGDEIGVDDLLDCKPPEIVNNRCSSNSDAGDSYTGPPSWKLDFGLANDVAWPAQFANRWQGGGHISAPVMFQNRAVTGSAPSDWLPGGILNGELKAIVDSNPDLIAMTMGANPLLDDLLLTAAGEECSEESTVATLEQCVQQFFDAVQLNARLEQIYKAVLAAPDAEVVVFQYHLSIPSANFFDVWQLETIADYFNQQVASAFAATEASVPPADAARLHMIEAQVDPTSPSPTKLPRFNIGLPPDPPLQTWTAPFDCGNSDFVDGQSHQSEPTQDELEGLHPFAFCPGPEWVIGVDSGIHPSVDGYGQYATTLANVVSAGDLIPPLP